MSRRFFVADYLKNLSGRIGYKYTDLSMLKSTQPEYQNPFMIK